MKNSKLNQNHVSTRFVSTLYRLPTMPSCCCRGHAWTYRMKCRQRFWAAQQIASWTPWCYLNNFWINQHSLLAYFYYSLINSRLFGDKQQTLISGVNLPRPSKSDASNNSIWSRISQKMKSTYERVSPATKLFPAMYRSSCLSWGLSVFSQ